jgi:hypothetical protein
MTLSQSQVKIGFHVLEHGYFQYVAGAIYCVLDLTDQNLIHGEIKNGLNSGISC